MDRRFGIVLSRFASTRPLGDLLAGSLPGTEPANHTLRFASIEGEADGSENRPNREVDWV
jgi:hypothetical protein